PEGLGDPTYLDGTLHGKGANVSETLVGGDRNQIANAVEPGPASQIVPPVGKGYAPALGTRGSHPFQHKAQCGRISVADSTEIDNYVVALERGPLGDQLRDIVERDRTVNQIAISLPDDHFLDSAGVLPIFLGSRATLPLFLSTRLLISPSIPPF